MSATKKGKRLRPGELDGQVTASAIGKGIERSAGAIANCLARLAKGRKVRKAKKRPRAYVLKETKSK